MAGGGIAVLFGLLAVVASASAEDVVVDSSSACVVCACDYSAGRLTCESKGQAGSQQVTLESVPHTFDEVRLRGFEKAVLASGAIDASASSRTEVDFASVKHVVLRTGCLRIAGRSSHLSVVIAGADKVDIEKGSVSAPSGGDLSLVVDSTREVFLAEQSFDVLRALRISSVATLHLSEASLKPRVLQYWKERPDLEITFEDVGTITSLPENGFTSAKSIRLTRCRVREVAENAFSGFQVETVRFEECSIDRIQSRAFPEQVLINNLAFENCSLTSVSEDAVQSAISSLEVARTEVKSMSRRALSCHVARVSLEGNLFQTLGSRSLSFQSWSELSIVGNRIGFLEQGALAGISSPARAEVPNNVSFVFRDNVVSYANRDGLKHSVESAAVASFSVDGNVFGRECDCDFDIWINIVCGASTGRTGLLDLAGTLKNSSKCRILDEFYLGCFGGESTVLASEYKELLCFRPDTAADGSTTDARLSKCQVKTPLDELWLILKEQVQVDSNKGLLLVILFAAILLSLIVSICTLLRWIVYTLQVRAKVRNEDLDWNFTKIEERHRSGGGSPCPTSDHYESLPLTREEEVDVGGEDDVDEDAVAEKERPLPAVEKPPEAKEASASQRVSAYLHDKPPTLTFYDEMIDLLQEKLDDPDNYATVADSANATKSKQADNESLYMDPKNKVEADA